MFSQKNMFLTQKKMFTKKLAFTKKHVSQKNVSQKKHNFTKNKFSERIILPKNDFFYLKKMFLAKNLFSPKNKQYLTDPV